MLNRPEAIALASCKLQTFNKFKEAGVPHPPYWVRGKTQGMDRKKDIIIARMTTRGSGGEGIVVVREGDQLPDAPLYTSYIRKVAEYRIHVMRDKVLMVQQKRRDSEAEQTTDQKLIRNHDNGWVFAAINVEFKSDVQKQNCEQAAIAAVRSLGLDFGAVDLVVAKRDGNPFVLEVNTAPGIQSPTLLEQYVKAVQEIAGGINYEEGRRGRVGSTRNVR